MQAPQRAALAAEDAVDLHEAAQIVRYYGIGACFQNRGAFHLSHGGRNFRVLDGKRAPKPAARFRFLHFHELQALDFFEQSPRLGFQPHLAQTMAAIMEGHFTRETGSQAGHAKHTDEESGKFMHLGSQGSGFGSLGLIGEQLSVKNLEHGTAGARSCHHDFRVTKKPHRMGRRPLGFFPITRIKRGLSATSLPFRIVHFVAQTFQDMHHGKSSIGIKLLNETGDKKRDAHREKKDMEVNLVLPSKKNKETSCQKLRFPQTTEIVKLYRPVAFLGPEGTFSHLLARKRFGGTRDLLPCDDLAGAFAVIKQHREAVAVVPIENSSGGTIYDTVDLLVREAGNIHVREDLSLDVRLALLGRQEHPVREIFSHFAPLQHHRDWLAERFPKAKICPVASTAVAAAMAAKSRQGAALAAPGAAELYGLDVLQFPIRPELVNVTRFYVVGQRPLPMPAAPPKKLHKTALVFRLKNACGSLHAFLGPFRQAKVNLRMIVSRPIPGQPETYVFFAEIEGAVLNAGNENNSPSCAVSQALSKAARHAETLQNLGSFPAGRRYAS